VNSCNGETEIERATEILRRVRERGARLWSKNGQLHYKAPKGALTQEEIARLRDSKGQIADLLERTNYAERIVPRLVSRFRRDHAPLTFSQLAYWIGCETKERHTWRGVASGTRLKGLLNIDALRKSIVEVVRRHEALRTRIVVCDGSPVQVVDEPGDCNLFVEDLTALPENVRDAKLSHRIERFLLQPIDFAAGQLFAVLLVRIRNDDHVLVAAMEHIISDGASLGILFRDLFTCYAQALQGQAFSLPNVPIQLGDYAAWQRSVEQSWIKEHGAYWENRLKGCQALRFPTSSDSPGNSAHLGRRGRVSLRLGSELVADLREWSRLRRTTIVMSVFTAYIAIVMRWCDVSDAVIKFQSDSRVSPNLENAIGYFASRLHLRIELGEKDSFLDLLSQVMEEYCRAYEHADFSYLEAQASRPEFAQNTWFNWIPQSSGTESVELNGSAANITCVRFPLHHIDYPIVKYIERDGEPRVALFETDEEIIGDVHFPLNRFSLEAMDRFGRNFVLFVRTLLTNPGQQVRNMSLCG